MLAVKAAADYCIWKAQNFCQQNHLQLEPNAIYDVLDDNGYVKLDKVVDKRSIDNLVLPE
jgi:hypothetical protein